MAFSVKDLGQNEISWKADLLCYLSFLKALMDGVHICLPTSG